MRHLWVFLLVPALLRLNAAHAQEADVRPLFDGETLDGWEGDTTFFRAESGAIVAGTLEEPIPHNAFLCTTETYADFELRLRAKLVGEGDNAGVQFRSRRVPDHHEVSGYQADMGSVSRRWFNQFAGEDAPAEPDAKALIWGALYDETRRNRFLAWADPDAVADVLRPGEWNSLTVRAEGPRIRIWLNDLQTVDFTETSHVPASGVICLQIHSGAPAEARYADVRLRKLDGEDG